MKVDDKVVVITGGGNGIGREMVLQFLAKGARVVAVDVNPNALEETKALANKYATSIEVLVADVTNESAIESLPQQVIDKMGAVDILINNAGIMHNFYRFHELDTNIVQRVIDINMMGVIRMSRAFLPHLLKRPEGYLVNMSSMASYLPVAGQSIYSLTKAGVKLFTEVIQLELAESNVNALVVMPGNIDTGITAAAGVNIPKELIGKKNAMNSTPPQKVAEKVIKAIEKNKKSLLVGVDAKMLHFLGRIAPNFAAKLVYSQTKTLVLSK